MTTTTVASSTGENGEGRKITHHIILSRTVSQSGETGGKEREWRVKMCSSITHACTTDSGTYTKMLALAKIISQTHVSAKGRKRQGGNEHISEKRGMKTRGESSERRERIASSRRDCNFLPSSHILCSLLMSAEISCIHVCCCRCLPSDSFSLSASLLPLAKSFSFSYSASVLAGITLFRCIK